MFVASLRFSWWKAAHPSGPLRGGLELPGWVPLADSPGPGLALLRSPGIPLLTPVLQPSHAQGAGGSCFFSCPSLSQRLEYSLDPFILPRKPYVHL